MQGSIPGPGKSLRIGSGNPLQYPCLENSVGRGAWRAGYSPWGRKDSDMTEHTCIFLCKTIESFFKWLELPPASFLLHKLPWGVALLSHPCDCCHSLFPETYMDPIVSILVSFISAGPHSKGEKRWIILFLSFNFTDARGSMLREIQTEEEERVLLKDDRPQCLYLALERRKRCFSGRWSIWKDTREISFFCDGLLHSP